MWVFRDNVVQSGPFEAPHAGLLDQGVYAGKKRKEAIQALKGGEASSAVMLKDPQHKKWERGRRGPGMALPLQDKNDEDKADDKVEWRSCFGGTQSAT